MSNETAVKRTFLSPSLFLLLVFSGFADDAKLESAKPATIQALQEFNILIGGWRGIGQPKRGSQKDAWQERAQSIWDLKPKETGIRMNVETGKQWKSALLSFDETSKQYTLTATLLDDSTRIFRGEREEKRLVLESDADVMKEIHRVTLSILGENRFTVLMEKTA